MPTKEGYGYWEEYATEKLVGKTIKSVRYMTKDEAILCGFYRRALVIILDDGSAIFPSKDVEGNDAGVLFGNSPEGENWTFPTKT